MLRLLNLVLLITLTINWALCEDDPKKIVLKDFLPILKAFRLQASEYKRQVEEACPDDDPAEVDCDCAGFSLPPNYGVTSIGETKADLLSKWDGYQDVLSQMVDCTPEDCYCSDGTRVKINPTDFCQIQELQNNRMDFMAYRMGEWTNQVLNCRSERDGVENDPFK